MSKKPFLYYGVNSKDLKEMLLYTNSMVKIVTPNKYDKQTGN